MTREEAIKILRNFSVLICAEVAFDMAIEALEQPEIIRCKDCQYNTRLSEFIKDYYCCDYHEYIVSADDFCSNAKRREEGDK